MYFLLPILYVVRNKILKINFIQSTAENYISLDFDECYESKCINFFLDNS